MRAFFLVILALSLAACSSDADVAASEPAPSDAIVTDAPAAPPAAEPTSEVAESDTVVVVFFGDSLTAGYGLSRPDREAYPGLLEQQWREAGLPVRVVNAGNSGETSAGGLRRVEWVIARNRPDVFVLALGANDGLRGQSVDAMRDNLAATLAAVREAAPEARLVVAGMEALPNFGADYTAAFREVFPEVAEATDATLIPFLLDGVGGVPRLNQADGVHPTADGQQVLAETVAEVVTPLVREAVDEPS